ncbi:MAG: glycosyltransferase [Actinomycetota bacterium]|nr:glycosyltransferase [Actinomycetota bacterium]
MTNLITPGNDYRSLRSRPDTLDPSVAVIVPVYNRASLLANVLAGLSRQSYDRHFDVVVVDDGSEEDIRSVVDRHVDTMAVRLVRQERDGFGLARARNLGLASVDADVVVFLDADCVPADDWLGHHVSWHRKASNLVVTGSRRHVDVLLDPTTIAEGAANLHGIASRPDDPRSEFEPDDWRGLVYRRSQRLLLGDAGFRAAIGGNSSMRRDMILSVGGASTEFRAWGGEDTELAWRLWNAGAFIVPEDRAIIYHQTHDDPSDADERRRESRKLALPLIADHVPHRFYRKEPSHLYTVPKVSWIVTVGDGAEADRAWREASLATYIDTELVLVGDGVAVENRSSAAAAAPDLSVAGTFGEAVAKARGEILAIVDGRARFDRRLLARTMRRFDDARVSAVRVGYRGSGIRLLRLKDLRRADAGHGRDGLPFFALIRRRELMKDPDMLGRSGEAWTAALDRSKTDLFVTDLVEVPAEAAESVRTRVPGLSDMRAAGAVEIARGVKRAVRPPKKSARPAPIAEEQDEARVGIEYIGFTGQQNLGDDAMLEAIRRLMPWAEIGVNVSNPRAVMLGGGTLFNSNSAYLNKVRHLDGPDMERVVFGTGVRNLDYWGVTERLGDWDPFLRSALSVGVRGPDSLAAMRTWGYDGPAEIIGDPALSLERPDGIEHVDGRVVLCPLHAGGECWGRDDLAVFDAFARTIGRLKSEGRDVVMMTAHPGDDRWAIEIMRRSGHPDLEYVAGYDDLDATLRLLASADLVIGERLHAVVLAAAVGTPFVAIEYRPKVRDFAESIDMSDFVVRTDEIPRLDGAVREMSGDRSVEAQGKMAEAVERWRSAQSRTARELQAVLSDDWEGPTR